MVRSRIFDCSHDYGHNCFVKSVSKSKLKARMLEFFREVEASGESLVVTDRGKEVLVIQPVRRSSVGLSSDGMILSESTANLPSAKPQASEQVLLEELRMMATPASPISESELMAPLPLADWEVEQDEDRNPWS